jgi:Phage virion morphogenesis family
VNAKAFSRAMRQLGKIPEIANRQIAKDLNDEIQKNFISGRDWNRKPFKPLTKAYAKRRRFPNAPIMTQTEHGRNSVRVTAYGKSLRATIGVDYMVMHQKGIRGKVRASIPTNKIPAAWNEIMLHRYEQVAKKVLRG